MMWEIFKNIDGFISYSYQHWTDAITLGYLIYFSDESIVIRDTINCDILFKKTDINVRNAYYYINEENIYFKDKNELSIFEINSKSLIRICRTEEENISLLNNYLCMGRTISRQPKINRSELLILPTCEVFYRWDDGSHPVYCFRNEFLLLENPIKSILYAVNLDKKNKIWELPLLGFSVPRFYKNISNEIFLVMQSFSTEHPTDKRYELWGINKYSGEVIYKTDVAHFDRFTYCPDSKRLYGLNGQMYLSIDPFSGAILSKKQVELGEIYQRQWISLGNQSITGNEIFFTLSGKPIVGRFNIANETIDEFIEINVDANKVDMRQPLNMPYYYKGKLYVRDNSGVMHILERKDYPASS